MESEHIKRNQKQVSRINFKRHPKLNTFTLSLLVGEDITRRIVEAIMNEIFHFLRFTTEVGEGEERWLPTLDLRISRV